MNATQTDAPSAKKLEVNMDTAAPFIRVDNLSKVFGTAKARPWRLLSRKSLEPKGFRAVDNVSFQVQRGEIFVIMGLSGSGKSTIIRMLNRLIDATEGSITIGGKEVGTLAPAMLRAFRNQTINMVFQHFGLFPHQSLLQNVAFGLKVRGVDRQTREAKATEALSLVGLGDRIHAMPDQLSGGMRQRVGLARALATDAEILLMDEPFGALDPLIRQDMQQLLIELQRNFKKTIVFVTHDLDEAMLLGDQIMVMKQGKQIQCGTALDLLESPADPYIERFVAEVNRSKVLHAGMLAEPFPGPDPEDGCVTGAPPVTTPTEDPSVSRVAHVPGTTALADLLPIFASGTEQLHVTDQQGLVIGQLTAKKVFAALSPKEYVHES
jgi:glycine betaine/proline transport system ATP-binding protein